MHTITIRHILPFLLLAVSLSFSSNWKAVSSPFPIHDATATSEGVWLATGGGLRFLSPSKESTVYTAADGLEETAQIAVVRGASGTVYSFSETGIVSRIGADGKGLRVINRSFRETGMRIQSGKVRAQGDYLWIPLGDRLSLFDGNSGLAIISWTRLKDVSFGKNAIENLLIRNDTVFVYCDGKVIKRRIPLDSIAKMRDLPDPSVWILDSTAQVFVDSLQTDFVVPDTNGIVRIDGKSWQDRIFCPKNVCIPSWIAQASTSKHWLGDSTRIWFVDGSTRKDYSTWSGLANSQVASVIATQNGAAVAWQSSSLSTVDRNGKVFRHEYSLSPLSDDYRQNVWWPLKSLREDSQGNVFVGTWGAGVLYFSLFATATQAVTPATLSPTYGVCIDAFFRGEFNLTYSIVTGVGTLPDLKGAFAQYWGEKRNSGLAYIPSEGLPIQCIPGVGSSEQSSALLVAHLPKSNNLQIFAGQVAKGEGADGVIDVHEVTNPLGGAGFSAISSFSIRTRATGSARDLAWDAQNQRLWVVGRRNFGYWNAEESGDSVQSISTFVGGTPTDLSGIEIDVQGNLWITSYSKGVFLAKPRNGHPDTLDVINYTSRDGLLSNRVNDVSLSTLTGDVWFAHDIGVSWTKNVQVRDASTFQKKDAPPVMVYPNPYRPDKHAKVVFDYLSEKARLKIMDAKGGLVREFSGQQILGGRAEWDGKNRKGQRVAPGMYQWIAADGTRSEHGRIMVIH